MGLPSAPTQLRLRWNSVSKKQALLPPVGMFFRPGNHTLSGLSHLLLGSWGAQGSSQFTETTETEVLSGFKCKCSAVRPLEYQARSVPDSRRRGPRLSLGHVGLSWSCAGKSSLPMCILQNIPEALPSMLGQMALPSPLLFAMSLL